MLAYTFDENTKEFLFTQTAQKNPFGEDYILPADSTFTAVPEPIEGYAFCFINENWVKTLDHRSHYQVKLNDVTFSIVDYLGEAHEGYQFISDEVYADYLSDNDKYKVVAGEFINIEDTEEYLNIVKNRKHQENTSKCSEKRYGMTFFIVLQNKNCEFDTTAQTQSDLQAAGMVTATGATYPNWVCNNGVVIDLTNNDVQLIFAQFFGAISPLYTIELNYKNLINACTTVEEVKAIVIDYDEQLSEV